MRRSPLLLVLLLAACSSGSPKALVSTPPSVSDEPTPTPTPTVATTTAAPSPAVTRARVTASPTPSPTTSRAAVTSSAPRPRRTQAPSPTPSPKPSPTRKGSTYGVDEVTGNRFSPSSLTLRVGDFVLVTDKDNIAPHTFTITALHVDSGGMSQGDTFRYRFLKAGTFSFICTYHEDVGMRGTVTVKP